MAPGKPCDVKDFFAFIFGQPCLSCCNRITNLFYLAKHWAIRTHFIIMTEQCVTNLANSVWKWIGRERESHSHREENEMWWVGTPAWGLSGWPGFGPTLCPFPYFMGFKFCSWPIYHWILALSWKPGAEIFLLWFQQQVYYRILCCHPGQVYQHCLKIVLFLQLHLLCGPAYVQGKSAKSIVASSVCWVLHMWRVLNLHYKIIISWF